MILYLGDFVTWYDRDYSFLILMIYHDLIGSLLDFVFEYYGEKKG